MMYRPEYYVCYGRVAAGGGPVEILHVQCIRGVALDQRATCMLALPLRREIVLAGSGGLVGCVGMVPLGAPAGCSAASMDYLCNDLNDLLADGGEGECPPSRLRIYV
jgi:hypothetical protein